MKQQRTITRTKTWYCIECKHVTANRKEHLKKQHPNINLEYLSRSMFGYLFMGVD